MNLGRLRPFVPVLIAVAALGAIACLPVSIARGDDIAVTRVREPAATIVKGVVVSQEFTAKGEAIRSLGLYLSRYGSAKAGTVQVTIDIQRGGQWQSLSLTSVPIAALSDTASDNYPLNFPQPLAVTIGQPLRITVQSSEADPVSAITWWSNPDFTHDGYAARVNGKQQEGILCFTVSYQPYSGRLIQLLEPAWKRATIFLSLGWQTVLLSGFATIALSFLVVARHLLRLSPSSVPDLPGESSSGAEPLSADIRT